MTSRRALALAALALWASPTACSRAPRCTTCGMRLDPNGGWTTQLLLADGTVTDFDTPRCAFTAWRSGKVAARTLRARDYYDRQLHDQGELRFAVGSDVLGPMGPDLVPVDQARSAKFVQDHGADRALAAEEVTLEILGGLR